MEQEEDFFADSRRYDRGMGRLSRVAGEAFLGWLSLPRGQRCLDIGCGTGSFTELLVNRAAPSAVSAIDPSEGQIAFANGRAWSGRVDLRVGDAMSVPFGDDEFDVAIMALVIQYVPDPAKAMSEIRRVVRRGGTVAAYVWPAAGDGHPMEPMYEAIESIGASIPPRPGNEMRTIEGLVGLFDESGLREIDGRSLEIRFDFASFDDYWSSLSGFAAQNLPGEAIERLKRAARQRLPAGENGRISYTALANAIRGIVP